MPLPCSVSRARALGRQLAKGDLAADDEELLADVLAAYGDALTIAQDVLTARLPGLRFTDRVESRDTLVDRHRRTPAVGLPNIRDVAGMRTVVGGGRVEQREVAHAVLGAFADGRRPPRLIDRIESPSSGYRALHIEAYVDDLPVEVQIRTEIQDAWAQAVEKLGDAWGPRR